jgi:hypothetical protein
MPPFYSRWLSKWISDTESPFSTTHSTNPKICTTELYPDPQNPEFVPTFTWKVSQFDPEFPAKIEALARSYIADDSSLSSVGSMTKSKDYSMPEGHIIGNDLWTMEIEDVAIEKPKNYLETALC